ncbi:MAG: hypothetical protein ABSB70_08620 [Candidatus Velthaea sp.]|jgi:hypothetical protein
MRQSRSLLVFLLAASFVCAGIGLRSGLPAAAATPAPKGASALTQHGKKLADSAPADEYFGPAGMSPISIRTTIGFLGRQYHYRTITDRDLLRKALVTEDALRRWRIKYPSDPWLAPTYFHLEQLYQAVQTQEARKHATAMLKEVVLYYPDTKQGHMSRSRLAAGFPPLVPEAPLLISPAPGAQPTPAAGESPAGSPPSEMPTAPAAAAPSPSPSL